MSKTKLKGKLQENFSNPGSKNTLVTLKNVVVSFHDDLDNSDKTVIRDTGFELRKGEILGMIGESGSGKSVITSLLLGMTGPTSKIQQGKIRIFEKNAEEWSQKEWIKSGFRGKRIGRIFQNPMSALNPTLKIRNQLIETLIDAKIYKNEYDAETAVIDLLKKMNIQFPEKMLDLYPHELSGGMIQRAIITMVIAMKPDIIIFDEPTTALDPIVQAEILRIIKALNKEFKISMIFITHDIGVISAVADRILIMYAGRIIERGLREQIIFNSHHPYTWGLLCSLPNSINNGDIVGIEGMLDMDIVKENQDAFAYRNRYALAIDMEQRPPVYKVEEDHYVESWLLHEKAPEVELPMFISELRKHYKK